MRSFCSPNSRSSSATRLAVAPGDPRERCETAGEGGSKLDSSSLREGAREETADPTGLVERSVSTPWASRVTERERRAGNAGSAGTGGAEFPRDRLGRSEGGTTPNETICSVVSGLTAPCDWGRGDPNKVRSRHWAREESLPGRRVRPADNAADKASSRSSAEADIQES